jgi:serine phosphatase RsbU (regulator of sigma subunit)
MSLITTRAGRREAPSTSPSSAQGPPAGYRPGAVAVASAVFVYFLAGGTETLVIEGLQPTEIELTWISDVVLALAFGIAVFLWLHLQGTRLTLSRLERDHIVLDTQLSLAAEIQRGLLPALPPDEAGLRWAARLVQAGQIGGDLYDFVQITPNSWLVFVGDVSGKGIPAALVLASIRTMFRMMAAESDDPGTLVENISQRLYEDHGGIPYLTCVILRIHRDNHELSYVNAGHPSGIVLDAEDRNGAPRLLASCGPPAGMFAAQKYQTGSLSVPNRTVSILVTDGITEAFDMLGMTGDDPVAGLLAQLPPQPTPKRICDALIERTAQALVSGEWQDDRTVVVVALDS